MQSTPDSFAPIALLLSEGRIRQALECAEALQASSAFDAECARALLSAARDWHVLGLPDEQRAACELALTALPEHAEALHLLGYAAQSQGEMGLAEDYFIRALNAKPDYAFARLASAQIRMMRTAFQEGREDYEARFDAVTEASGPDWRGLPIARWRGESLCGKTIYLWAEQGLGDIVMFAGFLPFILAQSPARVALGMFPKLMPLFARSFPSVDVEPIDDAINHALAPTVKDAFVHIEALAQRTAVPFSIEPLRAAYAYVQRHGLFDYAAPLGDLLVQCMPGCIPARRPPYLVADPTRVAEVRRRLSARAPGTRIGISWRTTNRRETMRNIALTQWLPLLRLPGCHFVSLQHHVAAEEIEGFCAAHDCRITVDAEVDLLADAEGLAALIAAQDAVVTIDNSNAHLAGALGVPTALLLPKGHNYRWPEMEGGGVLWYKSVTALRQREAYKWDAVMRAAQAWALGRATV